MMRLGNTGNKSNYLPFGLLPSAFIPKHFTLLQVWNASSLFSAIQFPHSSPSGLNKADGGCCVQAPQASGSLMKCCVSVPVTCTLRSLR